VTARDRVRLLLIEDEELVRESLADALRLAGVDVVAADSGVSGIAVLREGPGEIDVVLLDLSMPDLPGEEVFARLVAMRPDLPVILSTGHEREAALGRFAGPAPAGFLRKPYRTPQMLAEIRRCLGAAPA
jgi:two-component system, cell cycle sensor histidine kinase and response regulator CckA